MTIFKNYYKIYKELEEEVKFYSRENFMKQREIERLRKEIKELKKEIGGRKVCKKNGKTLKTTKESTK